MPSLDLLPIARLPTMLALFFLLPFKLTSSLVTASSSATVGPYFGVGCLECPLFYHHGATLTIADGQPVTSYNLFIVLPVLVEVGEALSSLEWSPLQPIAHSHDHKGKGKDEGPIHQRYLNDLLLDS